MKRLHYQPRDSGCMRALLRLDRPENQLWEKMTVEELQGGS